VAGINEALIYQHFDSKEELFEVAVLSPLQELVSGFQAYAHGLPPGTDDRQRANTYSFVRTMLDTLSDSLPLLGMVLFTDRQAGTAFYRDHIAGLLDSIIDVTKSNLASWSHREFDPELVTTAVFGMCWGLAMDAVMRGQRRDLDAAAEQICELLFRGLQAGEGTTGER
jgi:AcrR family transcriptional regulator